MSEFDRSRLWEAHNDLREDFENLRNKVTELERLHRGVAMAKEPDYAEKESGEKRSHC